MMENSGLRPEAGSAGREAHVASALSQRQEGEFARGNLGFPSRVIVALHDPDGREVRFQGGKLA
jgi:hypothetical protein